MYTNRLHVMATATHHLRVARVVAVAGILTMAISGCGPASSPASAPVATPARPNVAQTTAHSTTPGSAVAPASPGSTAVTKVLVFVEENHSLSQMKFGMPYAYGLAKRYGYATHYTAIAHPSLPNYISIAGGQTYGITDDNDPSANPVQGTSVFGQAVAAGRTAVVYADGMNGNCATSNGGSDYAVKHNPWAYFVNERGACQKYDVPVDQLGAAITGGTLPNVGMVIPNRCNDAHDCSPGTADAWFKGWMTKIFTGPDWTSGHLAVVLTTDEDDHSSGNTVLTVVIHPSQKGHVVNAAMTHFSLTRLYEEVTHLPYLSGAASATSMSTAFGLPLG